MQKKPQKDPEHKGDKTSTLEGVIGITPKGIGYVKIPDREEDIEIDSLFLNTALHRDTVRVMLHPQTPGERVSGEVVEILTRNKMEYVGVLERHQDFYFLVPQDMRMYVDIIVPASKAGGAEHGEKVLVAITSWDDPKKSPTGEVIKVIGKPGDNNVEMEAIVLDTGLRPDFPEKALREAEAIKKNEEAEFKRDIELRRDMRNVTTFTIDPVDAKDFDDAISIREIPGNLIEIGIHIADVSHYLRPGTDLDTEAARRGNSIYLVDRTIPMLPEVLSNDLCSLNPNEDKLTFAAIFTFKKDVLEKGPPTVESQWFGKTIINSDKRFSYEEAQGVLDDGKGIFYDELLILNNLAKKLRKKREENGALSFEHEEVRFLLDATGKPLRVYKKIMQDTNKLVEEFMLLANKKVARRVHELGKKEEKLFVYRVHDEPDQEKISDLIEFLNKLGYNIKIKNKNVSSKDLNGILKMAEGRAEKDMIQTAAVRSMAKAIYSTKNIGHYGLAFEHYTHFTSPIRRYADVMVHRLLLSYLAGKHPSQEELRRYQSLANYTSQMEQLATTAERTSIKYKQVEYMTERVGKTFDGVISGITEWGVYIEEKETKAEGMIRLRDMTDDFYEFDKKHFSMVGQKKKKQYRLGDTVKVKVKRASLDERQIDYIFV
ncbi:MAG: Ribonuclease R [Parcubacteria group bacterium GW2011_GWC1_43_11]|nr:MAG: Ribonuclease R [Parcubacteria group bacterium GW2011_GWC1_43_11]